jgi:hypothetical protein
MVGGHWGALQMVAWARMVADYTEEQGVIEGVKQTFDGDHACTMCKEIAAGRAEEEKQKAPLSTPTQDTTIKWISLSMETLVPDPAWEDTNLPVRRPDAAMHVSQWDAQPPVPPPELAAWRSSVIPDDRSRASRA